MEQKSISDYILYCIRLLLYPLTLIYGLLVWVRNRMYDAGISSSIKFSLPVITVGNLSTGGTGKTPHIEYLIEYLQYRYRVATMSRGYKRFTKGFIVADANANALKIGDEPMQYVMKYPEVVVSVAEERLTGIPSLLQRRPDIDVILLDDAFQHRSVRAGLNILITDYSKPFYNDHILPFGNLREGRSSYKRADIIVVSKCPPNLSKEKAEEITSKINPLPHQKIFFTAIHYFHPYELFGKERVDLTNKNKILVCGIARPEPLIQYLEQFKGSIHTLTYRDHHYFVTKDIEEIQAAYNNWDVADKIVVTTEKDATRLLLLADKLKEWGVSIAVMPIKVSVLFQQENQLQAIIEKYVEDTIAENNDDIPPTGSFLVSFDEIQ